MDNWKDLLGYYMPTYQFIYDQRRRIDYRLDLSFAAGTFLLLVFTALFRAALAQGFNWYFLPLFLLSASVLLLGGHLVGTRHVLSWIEPEVLEQRTKAGENPFQVVVVDIIKCSYQSDWYVRGQRRRLGQALAIMLGGIVSIAFAMIGEGDYHNQLELAVLVIAAVLLVLFGCYAAKQWVRQLPPRGPSEEKIAAHLSNLLENETEA